MTIQLAVAGQIDSSVSIGQRCSDTIADIGQSNELPALLIETPDRPTFQGAITRQRITDRAIA